MNKMIKTVFQIIVGCIILLMATVYKEQLIALDEDNPYVHPSKIYDNRGDELLSDTIKVYE